MAATVGEVAGFGMSTVVLGALSPWYAAAALAVLTAVGAGLAHRLSRRRRTAPVVLPEPPSRPEGGLDALVGEVVARWRLSVGVPLAPPDGVSPFSDQRALRKAVGRAGSCVSTRLNDSAQLPKSFDDIEAAADRVGGESGRWERPLPRGPARA